MPRALGPWSEVKQYIYVFYTRYSVRIKDDKICTSLEEIIFHNHESSSQVTRSKPNFVLLHSFTPVYVKLPCSGLYTVEPRLSQVATIQQNIDRASTGR